MFNSDLNFIQFWNGQAAGPIANPLEMALTHELVIETLRSILQYREMFKQVYGVNEITIEEVTDAIAIFDKILRTPNAPFDQWLKGDDMALTQVQKEGYDRFKAKGCTTC